MLERFLVEDTKFNTDLEMGRRTVIKYEGRNLVFVPDRKDRNLGISVGYFVPYRGKDIVERFSKAGNRVVKIIHDALGAEKLDKLELA